MTMLHQGTQHFDIQHFIAFWVMPLRMMYLFTHFGTNNTKHFDNHSAYFQQNREEKMFILMLSVIMCSDV
jgi:hypothetical protein